MPVDVVLPGCLLQGGLQVFDASDCAAFSDTPCSLMLQSVVVCDNHEFLLERLATMTAELQHGQDKPQQAALQGPSGALKIIGQDIQALCEPEEAGKITCAKITGCGHVFSAIPLLYAFVSQGFSCPLCRYGGGQSVDTSDVSYAPANLSAVLWRILCGLGNHASKRAQSLESQEQETHHGPPSNNNIRLIFVDFSRHLVQVHSHQPYLVSYYSNEPHHETLGSYEVHEPQEAEGLQEPHQPEIQEQHEQHEQHVPCRQPHHNDDGTV